MTAPKAPVRWLEQTGSAEEAKAAALLSRVPAPRAPVGARARVFERLSDPKPRRSLAFVPALAGAAAVLLAIAIWRRPAPEAQPLRLGPQVTAVVGQVRAEGEPIDGGRALSLGATLATGPKAHASLQLNAQGALAKLSPRSKLVVGAPGQNIQERLRLELMLGGLEVEVPQSTTPELVIVAMPWTIRARGGALRVRRAPTALDPSRVEVDLRSGVATITGPNIQETGRGPQRWSLSTATAVVNEPKRAETPRAERSEAKRVTKRRRARRKASPKRAKAQRPEVAVRPAPAGETAKPKASVAPSPKVAPQARAAVPARDDPTPPIPEASAPTRFAPSAPERVDWAARYRQARAERNLDRSVALFDEIAGSGSAYAEMAGHQAARRLMNAKRFRKAAVRFERLIGRFSNASLDQERHLSAIECWIELGEQTNAHRAIRVFLAKYPQSERRSELAFLEGELHRRRGLCAKALPAYSRALSSRRAQDALYFKAWCELDLGQRERGAQTTREYLERYPKGRHAAAARRSLQKGQP